MRSDMHKVITERPRGGGGPEKLHRRANLDPDLLPRRQGMRRGHTDRKWLTDLLGPLRRWLRAQVGRPWDDVHSEACAVIQPDSYLRIHVKTHLMEMVQRDTFLHDGQVWCFKNLRYGRQELEVPVRQAVTLGRPFYVHPVSRRLCEVPVGRIPRYRWQAPPPTYDCRWTVRPHQAHVLVDGLWYEARFDPFPARLKPGEDSHRFDLITHRLLSRSEARDHYGESAVCVSRRQLGRAELRRLGLRNAVTADSCG